MDDWTWTIGQVAAPFGIRGELKVKLLTDFPERFCRLTEVCLRPERGEARLFQVRGARLHKGQALLRLAEVETIEAAEPWRGASVQVRRKDAVPLPEGSYYTVDLVGMEVVTRDGRTLGVLDEVIANPGHDLLRIGEALIPAVREMVEVDAAARRIVVDPPEGLLEGGIGC